MADRAADLGLRRPGAAHGLEIALDEHVHVPGRTPCVTRTTPRAKSIVAA